MDEELKRVARDRASAAKKGSTSKKPSGDSDSSSEMSSEMIVTVPVPVPLVDVGNKEIEPPPSVQPAALGGNILQHQSDGKQSTLVDEEIDAIVQSISRKLRHELATKGMTGQEGKDGAT